MVYDKASDNEEAPDLSWWWCCSYNAYWPQQLWWYSKICTNDDDDSTLICTADTPSCLAPVDLENVWPQVT